MTQITEEEIASIQLMRTEGIGPVTYGDLMRLFKSAKAALLRVPDMARIGGKKSYQLCTREVAEKEIVETEKFGARIVFKKDPCFPKLLKQLHDCPPFLSMSGSLDNKKSFISIVGARNASLNAQKFCYKVARELAEKGFIVCSGLARGIDASAHEGAIDSTVAVLAGGIDNIYPPENNLLYDKIKEKGVLISESQFGTQPQAALFPKRNRIIAGISCATLVVEAAIKSGSLITAKAAIDYGRDVFAVPGFPEDPRCKGSNRLIKGGAGLLESAQDIIDSLTLYEFNDSQYDESYLQQLNEVNDIDMEVIRKRVFEMISYTPIVIDDIIAVCDNNVAGVLTAIIELELAGKITRLRGQRVCLCSIGDL